MRSQVAGHSAAPKPLAACPTHRPLRELLRFTMSLPSARAISAFNMPLPYSGCRMYNCNTQAAGKQRTTCAAQQWSLRAARSARHCRVAQ